MRFDFYLHHRFDDPYLIQMLGKIQGLLQTLIKQGDIMSAQLDALTAQVQANTEVEASAILLLRGLAAQIADLQDDPAALQALSDNLKASADRLAAAITENTPAA